MRTEDLVVVPATGDNNTTAVKSMTGRYPVLENTADGAIVCDLLPIARYLARGSPQFTDGTNPAQKAQIDSWVDYIQGNIAPVATHVTNQVLGCVPSDPRTFQTSLNELKQSL